MSAIAEKEKMTEMLNDGLKTLIISQYSAKNFVEGMVCYLVDKDFITFTEGAKFLNKTSEEFLEILKNHNIDIDDDILVFLEEIEGIKDVKF